MDKSKDKKFLKEYSDKYSRAKSKLYALKGTGEIEPSRRNVINGYRKRKGK